MDRILLHPAGVPALEYSGISVYGETVKLMMIVVPSADTTLSNETVQHSTIQYRAGVTINHFLCKNLGCLHQRLVRLNNHLELSSSYNTIFQSFWLNDHMCLYWGWMVFWLIFLWFYITNDTSKLTDDISQCRDERKMSLDDWEIIFVNLHIYSIYSSRYMGNLRIYRPP